jgi:RNA polymerase sigma factor (sigma-70 family)
MAALDAPPPSLSPSLLAGMSDQTLTGLIAAGSDDAFAALDARYRARLVRSVRRLADAGGADAEDAVQEAMVRAVRALRGGSRPEAVGAWLHRIARNCALDQAAARRRHPVVELADHVHPVTEDAQATVERRLNVHSLVSDVGELPETQRSALVLRELEGRTYADIADELDVTVPAVKSLLVRARQGLKAARDGRRAATWLPLPLLQRAADRIAALFEPVAASAAPKVACIAAVAAAGALPVVSGTTPAPRDPAAPKAHRAAASPPTANVAGPRATMARTATTAPAAAAHDAASSGLRADCADGRLDGTYRQGQLAAALGRADTGGHEYHDCRSALTQALIGGR